LSQSTAMTVGKLSNKNVQTLLCSHSKNSITSCFKKKKKNRDTTKQFPSIVLAIIKLFRPISAAKDNTQKNDHFCRHKFEWEKTIENPLCFANVKHGQINVAQTNLTTKIPKDNNILVLLRSKSFHCLHLGVWPIEENFIETIYNLAKAQLRRHIGGQVSVNEIHLNTYFIYQHFTRETKNFRVH
jgi:hypothetical protein